MSWCKAKEREYLSELLEYHLNELKEHLITDQKLQSNYKDFELPDDVYIQDPVLYHMILRSGQRGIDPSYAPFAHSNNNHYIITLPESNCVCSVSLGPSVWKDGYQHCLQITDPYRIHVALQVDNNNHSNASILQGVNKWKIKKLTN